MKIIFGVLVVSSLLLSCQKQKKTQIEEVADETKIENPTNQIGLISELDFIPLNPARGDKAPQAGAIYGNIRENVATGYIGKFKDGFSSPPHIHNITYRAIVMNGEIHNADEVAPIMWMPAGSIWTQPKGQPHITSAQGDNAMAYIEIDSGPYLVKPVSESFESDESPVNVSASNVIYLNKDESELIGDKSNAQIAYTWKKKNGENGYLLKLPAGFTGKIFSEGSVFYSIIIKGRVSYLMPDSGKSTELDQGSHFTSQAKAVHNIATNVESLIYIRTNDEFIVE